MKKYFTFFIFYFFFIHFSFSQIEVNQDELSDALKEKLMDEITDKITSSIQSGEKWAADASYFSVVLEPFESFGIDPNDPNFINQALDIHKTILDELDKNPELKYSGQLNTEIKSLVKNGMWNYASSYIDKDSKEIYEQISTLVSNGQEQISKLMDAASGISQLDQDSEYYESQVTTFLTDYGIKSDYFYFIDDLDQIISESYDKIAEPLSALTTIASAMNSNDPVYKIEMLFELGETFGGKVPIIGALITPIFSLGKGVLGAAKGLENVLENNLNQGCISPAGGTYGSINENKRTLFIKKFPNINRACPMNQDVYSPVYNNIYFNTSDNSELFFYMNKVWLRGKKDNLHKGEADIHASIQWLRENGLTENATNLNFIFTSYQKEYGWLSYTEEVSKRIDKIKMLFLASYQTVNHCKSEAIEEFYMDKIGLNWIERLLNSKEENGVEKEIFDWNDLVFFNSELEREILDQMIKNYYLSRHQTNLNNLDRIIKNLSLNTPINIIGTVAEGNGGAISGANLNVGYNSMFESGHSCQNTITSSGGNFSYFILLPLDNKVKITISAALPDNRTIKDVLLIDPTEKRIYRVNLSTPYIEPEIVAAVNNNNANGSSTENDNDQNPIDVSVEISNSDCAQDPLAVAEWDPINEVVICTCVNDYIWDVSLKKCVKNIQAILANSDCKQWDNTEAKWDYTAEEPYCDCKAGFEWNKDFTKCISLQEKMVDQTDCSQYGNAKAEWDPVNNEVICECLPGFEWDDNFTKCISIALAEFQDFDCDAYPNTEAIWDQAGQQAYCDCKAGYEWNDDFSACIEIVQPQQQVEYDCSIYPNSQPVFDPVSNKMVCDCLPGYEWNKNFTACNPIRNKPNIDWGNIIAMTSDILNGINAGNSGSYTTGIGAYPTGASAQQPVQHQSNCNDQQQAGANTPEVHTIDLGQSFGSFIFDYETFDEEDQIIIANGGTTIFNSGCVGERKSVQLKLNGFSSTITVRVNPNCDGGTSTAWNFTVHCPTY